MVLAAISLVAAAVQLLGEAEPERLTLPLGVPWLGSHFRLDALGAFFLIVIDLGAVSASLFALGYGEHETEPQRVLPFYATFLAGMTLVVLADDAFTFLFSWEVMSLSSWALVVSHHRDPDNMRAGYLYLVMASFGTLALLLAFGVLAGPDGLYTFAQMRAAHPSAMFVSLAIILALIGAGSKAGIVPLHVWLPLAHPAAPSHVSALMSGVMTKVAVYGFVRIAFDLAGSPAWWWSIVVLAVAGNNDRYGRAVRADAARFEEASRLSHGRKYRHHLYRPWPRAGVQGARHGIRRGTGLHRRLAARVQSFPVQEFCSFSAPAPC